jgi:hypothetical protein
MARCAVPWIVGVISVVGVVRSFRFRGVDRGALARSDLPLLNDDRRVRAAASEAHIDQAMEQCLIEREMYSSTARARR